MGNQHFFYFLFLIFIFYPPCTYANTHCNPEHEKILLELYEKTNGPDSWYRSYGWNSSEITNCCEWDGIECDALNWTVQSINLDMNRLQGTLPSSIWNLTALTVFSIYSNGYLHGTISSKIQNLTKLKKLNLARCNFKKKLPSGIGNLRELKYFDIHDNQFMGSLPFSIGNLKNLIKLDLSENNISGILPNEIGFLIELESLRLDYNNFYSLIPFSIGNLKKLQHFDLSNNQFMSSLPFSIGNLKNLTKLDLSENDISGILPNEIGFLTELESLRLDYNNFDSPIPFSIGNLKKLIILDFTKNTFTSLPFSIGELTKLTMLSICHNNLQKYIPSSIGYLTKLTSLDLYDNQLNWTLPTEIMNLTNLMYLDLGMNKMTNCIPSEICNSLIKLTYLDLSNNFFSCTIPPEIENLNSLKHLDLQFNLLSGHIPKKLMKLSQLTLLTLNKNNLASSLPNEISNLRQLKKLAADENNLKGTIPKEIGELVKLTSLTLGYNQFFNSIPESLGSLTNLYFISLASNNLTNSLPTSLGTLKKLQYLYLGKNYFEGSISFLKELTKLETLSLESNNFQGPIPFDLWELTKLVSLNLNDNYFSSSIPYLIGQLTRLKGLNLCANHLTLTLPKSISKLKRLSDLLCDSNHFTGSIPSEFGFLSELQNINLMNNQFNSSIPESFGNLSLLYNLQLGKNHLTSKIPISFNKLSSLKFLFLGYNLLSGKIPKFSSPKLEILSLENNLLSGEIPNLFSPKLKTLYLNDNLFTGTIPNLEKLTNLYNLFLQTNSLTGGIPDIFHKMLNLKRFYSSDNLLHGKLPFSLLNHQNLLELYLSKNLFEEKFANFSNITKLEILCLADNSFFGHIMGNLESKNLHTILLHNNELSGSVPIFKGVNIHQLTLMNNNFRGELRIDHEHVLFMVQNNFLSGKIKETKSISYCPLEQIMYPILYIYIAWFEILENGDEKLYTSRWNGVYYVNTKIQTFFGEAVYVNEDDNIEDMDGKYCYWSIIFEEKWACDIFYEDDGSFIYDFEVTDSNDRTSISKEERYYYENDVLLNTYHAHDLFVIGNQVCQEYIVIRELETLSNGTILKLDSTANYVQSRGEWDFVFIITNKAEEEKIVLSNKFENFHFTCYQKPWESDIRRHISILGNSFVFNKHYKMIAKEELSLTLMTPGWEVWKDIFIPSVICLCVFILFLFQFFQFDWFYFDDLECHYHFSILNFGLFGSLRYYKYILDILLVIIFFSIYSYSCDYYEHGYWLDNISIKNMMNCKNCEYILLFICFPIYTIYVLYLISLLDIPFPGEIFIQKKETKINFSYVFLYFFMCIIGISFSFMYIFSLYAPKNNYFNPQNLPIKYEYVYKSFPAMLCLLQKYTLPYILRKTKIGSKLSTFVTISAVIFFSFILPFVISFVLSNKCFSLWVLLWEPCYINMNPNPSVGHTFDIYQTNFPYETILNNDDICGYHPWEKISNSQCTRDIAGTVIDLSVKKLIFSIFIFPMASLLVVFLRLKCKCHHSLSFLTPQIIRDYTKFDTLFSYVLELIILGFHAPLIIVMVYVAVIFDYILMLFTKQLLRVEFISSDYSYVTRTLYLALFMNHILTLLFWIANGFVLSGFLLCLITIFWLVLLYQNIWNLWKVH